MQTLVSSSLVLEAQKLRKQIISSLHATGGGHYGGALSVIDLLLVLYKKVITVYPDEPRHPMRDRVILSKGHACIAQYCILADLGFFDVEELASYGGFHSFLEGHPDRNKTPGIDFSSGSLGQGLSVGVGMAFSLRKQKTNIWIIMGDGECQEGQVWEAVMVASRYKLDNLIAIVDNNGHQEYGWSAYGDDYAKAPMPNIANKFASFGWNVIEVDGHHHDAVLESFEKGKAYKYGPTVIVCNTVKGKGYPLIEKDPVRFHCGALTQEEYQNLMYDSLLLENVK